MRISRKHYKDADQFIYLEVKLINHNNLCIHIGVYQPLYSLKFSNTWISDKES